LINKSTFSRDAYGHGLENKNNGAVQILDNLVKKFIAITGLNNKVNRTRGFRQENHSLV
jgi:hypothetical protein